MAKNIPFKLILEKAKDYQADMTRFQIGRAHV